MTVADAFLDALGRPVTHKPAGGDPLEVRAIFRDQHAALSTARGDLSAYEATATVAAASVSGPRRGDGVIVDGVRYAVRSIVPDGRGLVALGLERLDRTRADGTPGVMASFAGDILSAIGRQIEIDGAAVTAQVNLNGVVLEDVGGATYETTAAVASVADADAAGAVPGAPVVIDGADYRVRDVQPDGRGLTRLILERL